MKTTENKICIAVIGSGVMGAGIASVAAANGHPTVLYDISESALQNAISRIHQGWEKSVEKERMTAEEKQAAINNLLSLTDPKEISGASLVIEAVPESIQIKQKSLETISREVSEETVIASNTSSFSITRLSRFVSKPERFLGTHFFNPADRMKLVEIISGRFTSSEVRESTAKIIAGWDKITVSAKDVPGFIVNRVARPFYCESLRILEEGIADEVTIDHAMKTQGGFRMGPFELMDLIGVETNFAITCSMYESYFHEPRYRPSLIQQQMSEAGLTGRKSGKGFYDYSENAKKPSPKDQPELSRKIFERVLVCLINEAADAAYYKVAEPDDIDLAVTKGVNYPKGLFEWAEELGAEFCVQTLDTLYEYYHDPRYRVSPWLRERASQ